MANRTFPLTLPGQSVLGMLPDQDPASIAPSFARELVNFRPRSGALVVRPGATPLLRAPEGATGYRGSWHGVFEAQRRTFVAFRMAAETRVSELKNVNGEELYEELEPTAPGLAADGPVTFSVVRAPDPLNAADLLVMGNGIDPNLIYSAATDQTYLGPGMGTNRLLPSPVNAIAWAGPTSWWTGCVDPPAGVPYISSEVEVEYYSGSPRIALKGGHNPNGKQVVMKFSASDGYGGEKLLLTDGLYFQWLDKNTDVDSVPGATNLFQYVSAIEVAEETMVDSVPTLLWRALNPTLPETMTTLDNSGWAMRRMVFDTTGIGIESTAHLRFTFKADANLDHDFLASIVAVAATGAIRGDCQHAFAFAERQGRGESLPALCNTIGRYVEDFKMGLNWSGIWPLETGILSRFEVFFDKPEDVGEDHYAVLYRSEPVNETGTEFGPFYRTPLAKAREDAPTVEAFRTIEWTETPLHVELLDRGPYPAESLYEAPDSLYLPSPKSTSLDGEAGRLFGCNMEGLWCGDATYPLRFRRVPRPTPEGIDDTSATLLSFAGEEARAVRGISAPTGANGLSPLVLLTDRSAYRVAGTTTTELSHPQRIAGTRGVLAAGAVTLEGGAAYWIDPEGRLNATDGAGTMDLSTGGVREWTLARIDPKHAFLDAWGGLVRCRLGGGDGRFLNFDPALRAFHTDLGPPYAGTLNQLDRWLGWDTEGGLWHLEDPAATGDGNDPIAAAVGFREVMGAELGRTTFDRVGLWARRGGPSDWTVKWEEPTFGDVQTGTIPSDLGDPGIAKWTNPRAVAGQSVQITVSGDFESGVTLRGVLLEANPSAGRRA